MLLFCGCTVEQPTKPSTSHAIVTRLTLRLVKAGADTLQFSWKDSDGTIGALPATADTVRLEKSSYYQGSMQLFSDGITTSTNITTTFEQQAATHQCIMSDDKGLAVYVARDNDTSFKPLGLLYTTYTSTIGGRTQLNVRMYHYSAADEKQSKVPGTVLDVNATFPLVVE